MGPETHFPLKSPRRVADSRRVRLSRLVIEGNQNRVSLTLHPKLTVVAGVPGPVRSHLVDEIIGGFTSARSGVHLEMINGSGRRITVVRPVDAPHRVTAPDEKLDLTEDFRDHAGRTDVLARYGIDSSAAGRILHIGPDAARTVTAADADIARLSCLDQSAIWSAAARVQVTQAEFQSLSEDISRGEHVDAQAVATIERRHQHVEAAVLSQQEAETHLIRLTLFSLLIALPVSMRSTTAGMPLLVIAACAVAAALFFRGKVEAARRLESAALASSGDESYLGFVVKQVDGLMEDTDKRRRLTHVAADHRNAAIAWTRLAGDVTVEWAFEHQAEIDAVARLQRQIAGLDTSTNITPDLNERTAAVARTVLGQMTQLRRIGYGAESFPLLLDDPFVDLEPSARIALLELIARSAGSPQVILLTEQADIADWARSQSHTGEMALLEPLGPTAPPGRHVPEEATAPAPPQSTEVAPGAQDYRHYGGARSMAG